MAHFAQLDENNIVIQVTVVSNDDAPDEATGIAFCKAIYGSDTIKHLTWTEISADIGYMWIFPVNYPIADDATFELYEWSDSVYEADNTKGWVLR